MYLSALPRTLAIAADNLDLIRSHGLVILQLERHILDQERPDLIAESIRIEMALFIATISMMEKTTICMACPTLNDIRPVTFSAKASVMTRS